MFSYKVKFMLANPSIINILACGGVWGRAFALARNPAIALARVRPGEHTTTVLPTGRAWSLASVTTNTIQPGEQPSKHAGVPPLWRGAALGYASGCWLRLAPRLPGSPCL